MQRRSLAPRLVALASIAATASAQVSLPPGFAATTIAFGSVPTGMALSPGGAYGSDLYVSTNGAVKRVDVTTGSVNNFATGLATGTGQPSGVEFDSGAFGTGLLYVVQNNWTVVTVSPTGVVTPFSSVGTLYSCNDLAMAPPASAYGALLFVANGNGGADTISSVTPAGTNAVFATAANFSNSPLGLDFAPAGSAFGAELFTSIYGAGQLVRVPASGSPALFASSVGWSYDLAFDPDPNGPFGDYVYVTDPSTGSVLRVAPNASVSTFASGFSFGTAGWDADLTFAQDGRTLFVGSGTSIVIIRACGEVAAYCTGKTNSQGCVPAIASSGAPDVSGTSDFLITCSSVLELKAGLLFYGFGPNAAPFQGGVLCVQQPVRRTTIQISSGSGACNNTYAFDFDGHIRGGSDPGLTAYAAVNAQWWMRDPSSPSTTGLSNGLRFSICP